MKIKLETDDGQLVSEIEVLPFLEAPAVVIWGVRTFVLWRAMNQVPIYREAFCYMIPTEAQNGIGNES